MTANIIAETIRNPTATQGIPIIAFSANCSGERPARAFTAGCLECYQKPVEFTLIDELIGRYASK